MARSVPRTGFPSRPCSTGCCSARTAHRTPRSLRRWMIRRPPAFPDRGFPAGRPSAVPADDGRRGAVCSRSGLSAVTAPSVWRAGRCRRPCGDPGVPAAPRRRRRGESRPGRGCRPREDRRWEALDTLPGLTGAFDLIFIDADKENNSAYLRHAIRRPPGHRDRCRQRRARRPCRRTCRGRPAGAWCARYARKCSAVKSVWRLRRCRPWAPRAGTGC